MAYSDEVVAFYHTTAWQHVRRLALERDKYLCQDCLRRGKITKANTVHHIEPIRTIKNRKNEIIKTGWQKRLDLNNLEAICPACHNAEHPEKGERTKKPHKKHAGVYKFKSL